MIAAFSAWWFVFLALTVGGLILSRLLLGKKSRKTQLRFLLFTGIAVFVYLAVYKVCLSLDTTYDFSWWNELPLNLCNLAPIFLILAAAFDKKPLFSYLYFNCTLGALVALAAAEVEFIDVKLLSARGLGYWGFHFLVLFLALAPIVIGTYRPRYRDILPSAGLIFLSAAIAHVINVLMRATVYEKANFFFTFGLEGNPIAEPLYNLLPVPLLWLIPVLPIYIAVGALMVTVTFPWTDRKKERR